MLSNQELIVDLGFTAASSTWIEPKIKVEGSSILISGTYSLKERPNKLHYKLPENITNPVVYWVDDDGKKHIIYEKDSTS